MFGEADVEIWCQLLTQAAREKDPERLAGILALIETAARVERAELKRRGYGIRKDGPSAAEDQAHPWSTLLAGTSQGEFANPGANSELYLRYLRLADYALAGESGATKGDATKGDPAKEDAA